MTPPTLYPTPERRQKHLHGQMQDSLLSFEMARQLAADAHVPPELAQRMDAVGVELLALVQSVAALRLQAAMEVDCGC